MAKFLKGCDDEAGFLGARKIHPVSASGAEAGTPLMVLTITCSRPLGIGFVGWDDGQLDNMKRVAQWLCASGAQGRQHPRQGTRTYHWHDIKYKHQDVYVNSPKVGCRLPLSAKWELPDNWQFH